MVIDIYWNKMQQTIHHHQTHLFNRPLFIISSTPSLLENTQKLIIVLKIVKMFSS